MKRYALWSAVFVLVASLLAPSSASADCLCQPGLGTLVGSTTWGSPPTWTCSSLSDIGHNSAQNYASSQCPSGVCSITFSNEVCVDPGQPMQHYEMNYRFRCYICD